MADKEDQEQFKNEVARLIVERADENRQYKSNLTNRAIDIYYDYIGQFKDEKFDINKRLDKKDWRTKVYPKFLKTKALAAWSQMIQAVTSNKQMIEVTAEDENDSESVRNASNMKEEINAQFERADFAEKQKIGILEMILYGSMSLEAPVIQTNTGRKVVVDQMGTLRNLMMRKLERAYKVVASQREEPTILNRNFFEMYPSPFAVDMQSCENVVHRPFLSDYQLNELMSQPGFDKKIIKDLLKEGPSDSTDEDKTIQKAGTRFSPGKRQGYDTVCYSGRLPLKELVKIRPELSKDPDNVVGFVEVYAWAVSHGENARLLKLEKNPDPAGKRRYHMSVYERVPYETFGVGIGENISDWSKVIRGSVNLFMDTKKAALPMLGVDSRNWTPGQTLTFAPFKIWQFQGDPKEKIYPFNFPDVSNGLIPLIELAERYADELTGIPKWTTGNDSKMLNKTATGISMLMNAQSQLMRGAIENLDDYIVEPIAEEFYFWNMVHNPRPDIKGVYRIAASGLSTLMQKETLNQQLLGLLSFVVNPMVIQNPIALKFLRIVGENIGIKDVDSILPDPDQMQSVADMSQMAMMQQMGGVSGPGGQGRMPGMIPPGMEGMM